MYIKKYKKKTSYHPLKNNWNNWNGTLDRM